MNEWKNLDELKSFQTLKNDSQPVDLTKAMAGEAGAGRVAAYQVPMAAGLTYSYAAKQVDDGILQGLKALAEEAQLAGKFEELYNGAVINTGEKRLVLHQLTRGQLGNAVIDKDFEAARSLCARASTLLADRNRMCKLNK